MRRRRAFVFAALALWLARPADASCGSTSCFLVTHSEEGVETAGAFQIDLSYQYVDQTKKLAGHDGVAEVIVPKVDFEAGVIEPGHHREVSTRGTIVRADLAYGVTSRWSVISGYALQRGEILESLSATARAGAELAQVPRHSISIWNRYELTRKYGVGLGLIHRTSVFTSTDNTVTLPAFTRVDAGFFATLTGHIQAQINVENVMNTRYFASAHSNTNITPGSPRAVRMAISTRF